MSKTMVRAGRVVVGYVADGQGRRLVLGEPDRHGAVTSPVVAATHKGEARALVKALRELLDELPDDPAGEGERVHNPRPVHHL
jgi:hypothetical protein